MSASSLAVGLAARTLPRGIRDQYREQWLADVRDAPEAGMRPSSIAIAAFAFAVQVGRPLPARRARDPRRGSRLALGLALSAALLVLTNYAAPYGSSNLTDNTVYDFSLAFVTALLMAYEVLAPIAALILVRGRRARVAVLLLVAACFATIVQRNIDSGPQAVDNAYLTPGMLAYPVALVLVLIACALVWQPQSERGRAASPFGGLIVGALTALGLVYGLGVWAARPPVPPEFVESVVAFDPGWLQREQQFETSVQSLFWGWTVGCAALGILVFVIGRQLSRRRSLALTLAAVAIVLISASGVVAFAALDAEPTSSLLVDPLRLAGQALLAATILFAVGGVRYLPRVGHRHDVKGTVELL